MDKQKTDTKKFCKIYYQIYYAVEKNKHSPYKYTSINTYEEKKHVRFNNNLSIVQG